MTAAAEHHPDTDLVISRVLAAPRAAVWRAWTEPDLLRQWWCPRPWTTEVRAFELRAGGAFHTFMQGPEGGRCWAVAGARRRRGWASPPSSPWKTKGRAAAKPRR